MWVTICPRAPGTTLAEVIVEAQNGIRKIQILRLPDVCKATGLGRSMVYQLEADQRFPARVRIGSRAVGWVEEEIQGWLAERIQRSRARSG
jgi:prophage regulatory protein